MTKFVFIAVIAVLAAVLYSIPSHSSEKDEAARGMQNPGGQAQDKRKSSRERTVQQRERDRTKIQVPPSTPPAAAPATPPAVIPPMEGRSPSPRSKQGGQSPAGVRARFFLVGL